MTETAEISQSAVAQAGERLAKYIQLSERIKDAIKSSNDKCVEARALVARYAENEDAARKALEEQRLKLEQAESEYVDAVSFLKRQNEALCEARLECTMLAIEGECIQFLIASAPDPSDSALRLSMGRTYLRDGCTALKLLNNELINNATSNFWFAVQKGMLMYLVETLNVLATIVPGDNVHIARRQFAVYLNNWKDEKHPLTELRENGAEFRARLDREWKLFVDMLGSVCKDAEVALSALQTDGLADEADAGKPQRTKGASPKRRPRRRRLLTLDHNEQLKKHGYEVKASRDTIVFRGGSYLLMADKVVAIVNNLIVQLCTCPENPYIRFTSNDSKNFNRGAYRKFFEDCIVRKKHVDVFDSSVVITEPLARRIRRSAMAGQKTKKYRMQGVPAALSEKGGYTASFVSDGYTVDGRATILPEVLHDGGMKVSEGLAWDIVHGYTTACLNHTATTGETVDMGDVMAMLSIRGWYEKKDSKAIRDNVRVSLRLKEDMRPKVTFSMSNVLDGRTLMVYSATTPGCEPNHVRQDSVVSINGLWLTMLDGDSVTATMKDAARHDVSAPCEIITSQDDRVDVRVPAVFNAESFVGKDIVFVVTGSCGMSDMSQQSKKVVATLLAGDTPPEPPVGEPTITSAKTRGESEGSVNIAGGILDVVGANLETATAVELHSDTQPTGEASLWQTLPATYADGKLTTGELNFDEKPSDGGFVRVETAGGSALYPITYCAH